MSRPRTMCSRPLMRRRMWFLMGTRARGYVGSWALLTTDPRAHEPSRLRSYQPRVRIRPAIPEELPRVAHFADLVEVELRGDECVFVAIGDGEELSARIDEVALSIKLADVPRSFESDAIDRADEVAVRDGVRRLLELPEVFAQSGDCRRRIEHDLRSIQPELARAFGEVAVVADVDADLAVLRIEDRIAEVAGTEVELFPEAGGDVRDVVLAVLAEVGAVGVDDGGGVVVDAGRFFLVERDDDDHAVLPGVLLHELRRRAVGDALDRVVPARVLLGAEVRTGEDFLHADHLHAFLTGLIDVLEGALELRVANGLEALVGARGERGLDQAGFHDTGHGWLLGGMWRESLARAEVYTFDVRRALVLRLITRLAAERRRRYEKARRSSIA